MTIHLEKPEEQPKHYEMTLKLNFSWMNNKKPFCMITWKKVELTDFKWGKAMFDNLYTWLNIFFLVPIKPTFCRKQGATIITIFLGYSPKVYLFFPSL